MDKYEIINIDFIKSNYKDDLDFIPELMEVYLVKSREKIEKLKTALLNSDGEDIRSIAHYLKGSVGAFGAKSLVDDFMALETMGSTKNCEQAAKYFKEVISLKLEKFNQDLEHYIGSKING